MTATATLTRTATTDQLCDRCGARAKTRVVLPSSNDLLFCGHHGAIYGPQLLTQFGGLRLHIQEV